MYNTADDVEFLVRAAGTWAGFGTISKWADVRLFVGNSHKFIIKATNGFVGIGNMNPTEQLDVGGNIKLSGFIESPGMSGAGNAYACVDTDGKLYRNDEPCNQNIYTCSDTDGLNQFVKGTIYSSMNGVESNYDDVCINDNIPVPSCSGVGCTTRESGCNNYDNTVFVNDNMPACEYGCNDGKCNSEPLVELKPNLVINSMTYIMYKNSTNHYNPLFRVNVSNNGSGKVTSHMVALSLFDNNGNNYISGSPCGGNLDVSESEICTINASNATMNTAQMYYLAIDTFLPLHFMNNWVDESNENDNKFIFTYFPEIPEVPQNNVLVNNTAQLCNFTTNVTSVSGNLSSYFHIGSSFKGSFEVNHSLPDISDHDYWYAAYDISDVSGMKMDSYDLSFDSKGFNTTLVRIENGSSSYHRFVKISFNNSAYNRWQPHNPSSFIFDGNYMKQTNSSLDYFEIKLNDFNGYIIKDRSIPSRLSDLRHGAGNMGLRDGSMSFNVTSIYCYEK